MAKPRSDALVFFGATGDLAYKKIFPALQAMARRGKLDFPVVGVAKSGWTRDQLVERARASVTEHGGGEDPEAFAKLAAQLRYVDGDYNDAETFTQAARRARGQRSVPRTTWRFRRACSRPWSSSLAECRLHDTTRASSSRSRSAAIWSRRRS